MIFLLFFKANYQEFAGPMSDANSEECVPPPPKKAKVDEAATIQSGRKPKREWMASYNMENPADSSMQDREIADPVAQEHSDAVPSTLQRSLPGPSGTQVQPRYKNVSVFFLPII